MVYISDGLSLKESGLSGQRWGEWLLDGEDAPTAARVDGYITDANEKGMRQGDIVTLRQWTSFTNQYTRTGPVLAVQLMVVAQVNDNGSADLTDGTAISVTDTD